MERFDSLPRVEEELAVELPVLMVDEVNFDANKASVRFHSNGMQTIVALNDAILGMTSESEFTISGLRSDVENRLTLIPLRDDVRGEPVEIVLNQVDTKGDTLEEKGITFENETMIMPKVPNTGRK